MSEQPPSPDPAQRPPVDPPPAYAPPPPPGYAPAFMPAADGRRSSAILRALVGLFVSVLIVSLIANVYLAMLVFSMGAGVRETEYQAGDIDQRIVIVPVRGLIDDAKADFVHDALDLLRDNEPAAIILRVDSGGGMVSPSDRIWHELTRFREQTNIPIVASFGGMAASGGYYIAAPADRIVAEPTCITGSIGVMAQAFTIEQLLQNIGVTPEVLVAPGSPQKDVANNIMRAWTEEDRDKLRAILAHAHEQFVSVVQQGRRFNEEQIAQVSDGRIFTADAALEAKLIDQIGYLDRAIELAKEQAGIAAEANPRVTVVTSPTSLLGSLMRSQARPASASLDPAQLRNWVNEWTIPQLLYLWQGG